MIAYTDGSCLGNGSDNSKGGFGVVILNNQGEYITSHQVTSEKTTNNREELKAILFVLLRYGKYQPSVIVYSDSAYCVNSLNNWIHGWARNNWIKSDGKAPENLDIMKAFYEFYQKGYRIDLRKIKGHAGYEWNELADALATGRTSVLELERKYNGDEKIIRFQLD